MAPKAILIAAVLLAAFYVYSQGILWMSIVLFVSAITIAVSYPGGGIATGALFPESLDSKHSPLQIEVGHSSHGAHAEHSHGKTPLGKLSVLETMAPEFGMEPNILNWESLVTKKRAGLFDLPMMPGGRHDKLIPHAKIVPIEGKFEVEIHSSDDINAPKIIIEDDIRVEPQHSKLKGGYDPMNIVHPRWRSKKTLWDTQMLGHYLPHFGDDHGEGHH